MRSRVLPPLALLLILSAAAAPNAQQLRKIGEMELALVGLSATVDGARPAIPKNVASGVRILISGGGSTLAPGAAARLLGAFDVEAELSGPSFGETVTVRQSVSPSSTATDLVLPLPAMAISGEHTLSNLRIVSGGRPVLDLQPRTVPVDVVEQVLITSVRTRPLTLQEIKDKGIVLDSDDYLGFEFTLGVLLESKPVNISFPVVFNREGVAVPLPQSQSLGLQVDEIREPVIIPKLVPVMMTIPKLGPGAGLLAFEESELRIPSLLVIPGEVGYLKQFFSAQLFVGNGTPATANLIVRDLKGTLELPKGLDATAGTADDPLSLAETVEGIQPLTMNIAGVGADGKAGTADDVASLHPGEQGQAEFLVRGDLEGFHNIAFGITGILDGLPTGPIEITGRATGGVLVRNPFFDVSFTLPTVVRANEPFKLYATVTNKGAGIANDVSMTLDSASLSGLQVLGDASKSIATLMPGEAETLVFDFESFRTGQAVATYLRFEGPGATGSLKFKVGVGERGVPLSPDTLVLPSPVDELPLDVITTAMRVLGQAWSIANTPPNAMPAGVTRISKSVVTTKALALAEAGLRIRLGQPDADAIRDLLPDFYGPAPIDRGFDQLLRTTDAGRNLTRAIGAALAPTAASNPSAFEAAFSNIAASGKDFIAFSIADGANGADVGVKLVDAGNRTLTYTGANTDPRPTITSAAIAPLGPPSSAPLFGLIAAPTSPPYVLELTGRNGGPVDLSVTYPRGDGQFTRATVMGVTVPAGAKARVAIDPARASPAIEIDTDANGSIDTTTLLSTSPVMATGPHFISASVVGPEVVESAGPFGFNVALLFDRVVSETAAADPSRYSIPDNRIVGAHRQLSGRLVFGSLAKPEGSYIPTSVTVSGMTDLRGVGVGTESQPLQTLVTDPGAVISGRVINGDGQLAAGVRVMYWGNTAWKDCQVTFAMPFAETVTDSAGRYQFRYVARNRCGFGWSMEALDEINHAQRRVSGNVRTAGERVTADIALLGRGAVTGIVSNLSGAPVANAKVVAVSTLETQVGGSATTDGDGRYTIFGITVGPISVKAAKGISAGTAAGYIARAGTTATANLTLNSGTVAVSGVVKTVENGVASPAAGAIVVFESSDPFSHQYMVSGAMTVGADGRFAFTDLPAGPYILRAQVASGDRALVTGVTTAGDVITGRDLLIPVLRNARVSGVVLYADGTIVQNPVVTLSSRGTVGESNGTFVIENALVSAQPQRIEAYAPDGIRQGQAEVLINQSGQQLNNVVVTLNGIGTLDVVVIDSLGNPVRNQIVQISKTAHHVSPNDCTAFYLAPTDDQGRVQFAGLEVGPVRVVSIRATANGIDIAKLDTAIPYDGAAITGVLRFGGGGSIRGKVIDDQGNPVFGANIEVSSRIYNGGLCQFVPGVSHRIRTNLDGTYRVTGVPVGSVSISSSQEFFPTPVGASGVIARDGDELVMDLRLIHTVAGKVTGTVFMPDGVTPAGAGVTVSAIGALPEVLVLTNAEGKFAFPKIFPASTYTITVRDPQTGFVQQERVALTAGTDLVHNFRLRGRGTVRVKVVDGAGLAVSDALVSLTESAYPEETFEAVVESSNEGVATFAHVHEGDFSVSASDANGRGGRISGKLPSTGSSIEVTVRLTVTGTVTGRFLMPDGVTTIPFGAVKLFANSRQIGNSTTDSGENSGAYTFTYVPAGTVRVEGLDPATGRSGVAIGQITTDGQTLTLDVKAQGLGTVNGVVRSNGEEQDGAHVEVSSGTFKAQTNADSNGFYSVPGVPEGLITVRADVSGALASTASGTLLGEGNTVTVNVDLQASGTVLGVVTRADGVTPAPPSIVTLQMGNGGFSATTNDLGEYRFDVVPAGTRSLSVDVIGSIDTAIGTAIVTGGQTTNVPLQLVGVGTITGTALSAGGTPVTGTVRLTGTGTVPWSTTLTLSGDGTFTAAQVLAGPFTALVHNRVGNISLYGSAAGVVTPGGTTPIVVTLQPTGEVRGIARRADNTTAATGATVTLKLDSAIKGTAQVFSDGSFSFTGLPLGTYSVAIYDPITDGYARALNLLLAQNGDVADAGVLALDDSALAVVSIAPADGTTGVALTQPIVVTLSDPLASTTGFTIKKGASTIGSSKSLSADGRVLTVTGSWPDSSEITVEATSSATDVFGRHLVVPFTSRFVTVDTTAPTVTDVTPLNDAYQVSVASTIEATFSEPIGNANVNGVIVVKRSGVIVPGTTIQNAANRLTFTPDAPLSDNAIYTVTVDGAVDASGNEQGAAKNTTFSTIDDVAPVLTITAPPAPPAWLTDSTPQVTVSRSDATSGINLTSATLSIDGAPVTPFNVSGGFSYNVPAASPLADGTHTIAATSADRAGNQGSASRTVQIDATAPSAATVTEIGDGAFVTGPTTITAEATDALSGVKKIQVYRDGTFIVDLNEPSFTNTWNASGTLDGQHTLTARAVDVAGNTGPFGAPFTIVVDNHPTLVTITSPLAGFTTRRPVTATATVDESVQSVDFTLGGVTVSDTSPPYSATLPITALLDGPAVLTVQSRGFFGESTTVTRSIVIDRSTPVARWPFDDGSGLIASDASGNGHPGTLVNGPAWVTFGQFGKTLRFDGVDDAVSVADSDDFDALSGLTLSAWVKPESLGTPQSVMYRGGAYSLSIRGDGRVSAVAYPNGVETIVQSPSPIQAQLWSHVAATYDQSALRLFVDGVEVASTAANGELATTDGPVWLGSTGTTDTLNGTLDETRLYDRALSASEMLALGTPPVIGSRLIGDLESSFVAKPGGPVWSFGRENQGDLGQGGSSTATPRPVPTEIAGVSDVIDIAAGSRHVLLLTSAGTVYVSGDRQSDALGDGGTGDVLTPVPLGLDSIVAVAAGAFHSLALRSNGDVYTWGSNSHWQQGNTGTAASPLPHVIMTGVKAIAAGESFSIFIKTNGTVWGVGEDNLGQLGSGSSAAKRSTPVQMAGITNAVEAVAGSLNTVVRLNDGTLKGAGRGAELGIGTQGLFDSPQSINLTSVVRLASGSHHTLALRADGTVWGFGFDSNGSLDGLGAVGGNGVIRLTPVRLTAVPAAIDIGAGANHSFAVTDAGVVYAWGENLRFEIGDGVDVHRLSPVPITADDYAWKVSTPRINSAGGSFTEPTPVITNAMPDVKMYFTRDGSEPTENDTEVLNNETLTITVSQTLRVKAFKDGMPPSNVASATYVLTAERPTMTPNGGQQTGPVSVTLATTTPGATIRYMLRAPSDPSVLPTASSPAYTEPILITGPTVISAIAFKDGWSPSSAEVRQFSYKAAAPVISPNGGTFSGPVTITITGQPGATIYYATDDPVTSFSVYTGPFLLQSSTRVSALATQQDYQNSPTVTSNAFTITIPPTNLLVSYRMPNGTPIAGATVLYQRGSVSRSATTGANGEALLTNTGIGDYVISVNGPEPERGTGPIDGTIPIEQIGTTVSLPITAGVIGGPITVRLLAADGVTPVPFFSVRDLDNVWEGGYWDTDEHGVVEFPLARNRAGVVEVRVHGGNSEFVVYATLPHDGPADLPVVLPIGVIRGVVTLGDGTPLENASVFAQQQGDPWMRYYYGVADPNVPGGYVIAGPLAGDVLVTAEDSDTGLTASASATITDVATPVIVDLAMPPTGIVRGVVRDASNQPLPFVEVTITTPSSTLYAYTDEFGEYIAPMVPVGEVIADIYLTFGVQGTASGTLANAGDTLVLDIQVAPNGTVSGTVRDANGNPVTDYPYVELTHPEFGQFATWGNADGTYTFEHVPIGDVSVTATLWSSGLTGSAQGTLAADGDTLTLDVTLPPAATVSGTIRTDTGAAVPNALVWLQSGTGLVRFMQADASGTYAFTDVPYGSVTVAGREVIGLGVGQSQVPVNGSTSTIDVTVGAANLKVVVKDSNGVAVSGSGVSFSVDTHTLAGTIEFSVYNVPNGGTTISRFAPGTVTITAARQDKTATVTVTHVNGVPQTVNVILPP